MALRGVKQTLLRRRSIKDGVLMLLTRLFEMKCIIPDPFYKKAPLFTQYVYYTVILSNGSV